jgi:hypothetical protein
MPAILLQGVYAPGRFGVMMRRSATLACLILGGAALGGCSETVNCSGAVYRSGCTPGPIIAAPVTPAPSVISPATPPAPPAVPYGDPATFAGVDDRQCRSYGLTFGSRDYADCRIRLSAQHRGLDPNIGTTPASR